MKAISYFFFYTYIGLVVVAGFWGAFIGPKNDYSLLFNFDIAELNERIRNDMLSQYRFLRAIELGFGTFAFLFVKEIFSDKKFNKLFLFIMLSGIMARVTGILIDGSLSPLMYFFLLYEVIGLILIFFYSRKKIYASR